jgi:hypothetical protein
MNMRKYFICGILATFAILMLAGCGDTQSDAQPTAVISGDSNTSDAPRSNPAPRNIQTEPANMFTFEFDAALGGIRLTMYHGELTQLRIPNEIEGFPVVAISATTFVVGEVTDVYLPETVRVFEWGGAGRRFAENMPEHLIVPYGVTHILGPYPFLYQRQVRRPRQTNHVSHIRSVDIPPHSCHHW